MFIIRPATLNDMGGIERCAMMSGAGMIHLPKLYDALKKKIEESIEAFNSDVKEPINENYFFVLSDAITHEVGGTCCISSRTGVTDPFYVYRIDALPPLPDNLPQPKENRFLQLKTYQNGPSELCALYLLPEFRKEGLGKLLSLSRFLFIASHPHRFTQTLIANMRGVIEKKHCPFWEAVGRHFVDISFEEVMSRRAISEKFLADIIPKYPIYVSLLPPEIRADIGQMHPHTVPAFKMLSEQGFRFIQEVDPIDGGPIIAAEAGSINAIKFSSTERIDSIISEEVISEPYILCNPNIDFRACYGTLKCSTNHTCAISVEIAEILNVKIGDPILRLPYHHSP